MQVIFSKMDSVNQIEGQGTLDTTESVTLDMQTVTFALENLKLNALSAVPDMSSSITCKYLPILRIF